MKQVFYASGKILLTSEFMILHGAKALASPVKKGQQLSLIPKSQPDSLLWEAQYNASSWFKTRIKTKDLQILETTDQKKSENLVFILKKLISLSPEFKNKLFEFDVKTVLEFNPHFGLGSSSTLTSLLAQWADVDPMRLHFTISNGSGYDVACADASKPITYQIINQIPVFEEIDYTPDYIDKMYLVYLGTKQVSSNSVSDFFKNYKVNNQDVDMFSSLTDAFISAETPNDAGSVMKEHEEKLAKVLKTETLQKRKFPDLEGYIKSLGAWGGDFALIISNWDEHNLKNYFLHRGLSTIYRYGEMVI